MTAYQIVRSVTLGMAARLGFQIQRICPTHTPDLCLRELLNEYEVDLVLDVGANVGQYAGKLIDVGWNGRIVSFEPLSHPYEELIRASASHPNWEIAPRCCIGDQEGEIEVNISENSVASSVLPLTDRMDVYSPDAKYIETETAPMYTLDHAAEPYLKTAKRPFLKIDVQGYEENVLAGAARTFPALVGLEIEMSFIELYEGQMLFSDMLKWVENEGFIIHRMVPSFSVTSNGRWLQVDVILFRDMKK